MTVHDRAAIISIGDELILGQTLDTNSRWISATLGEWNIRVAEHVTVPDDLAAQVAAMRRLAATVPLLICTGGLGPTADDLTRTALAELLGEPLVLDDAALAEITAMFQRRGRALTDLQRTQAMRPRSAAMLPNPHGTAPGLHAQLPAPLPTAHCPNPRADIFCLPGPPNEMMPMLLEQVRPRLNPPHATVVSTRILHTLGAGEGDLAQRLGNLMNRDRNPLVGTTASGGVVSVRIRYEGPEASAAAAVAETEARCRASCAPFVFGTGEDTIMSVTLDLLRARGEKLDTVESCTGGLVGSLLTSVPGSSDAYLGGWVTYANNFKTAEVGVPEHLLQAHGAVSEPVARAMADGALAAPAGAAAAHALAITGVAGPGGGSDAKPVGTVFIALASRGSPTHVRRFAFSGGRDAVRDRAAKMALAMLRFRLLGQAPGPLLWETPL